MKKSKLLLAAALLVSGSLVSCGDKGPAKMTVGTGYSATFENKAATDWAPAMSQVDLTAAFASFDKDGKVIDARFDVVQLKFVANEAKDGLALLNTNVDASYSVTSKLELGDAYNMRKSSGIGKEVDEQIEAFADWTVGKTVAEVRAAIPEGAGHGTAVHADLTTSVTITVDAFISALQCAYENRTEATYDVVEGAQAGIALQSGLAYNYGKPTKELDVVVAGAMVKDGKVVAGTFDQVVYPVAIAEDGSLSGDTSSKYLTNNVLKSKKVLKDAYAMQPASDLEKGEWYQQAEVLDAAVVGLGQAEITALVKGEGALAGCTMTASSYLAAYAKAVKYAPLADVA